jgi:predicted dehydrogenase
MIRVSQEHHIRLMVGYRLHFERSNMRAAAIIRSGEIGLPRIVDTVVSFPLDDESPRTRSELFGGPMYDIGIYGINAARYLFRAEPHRVTALASALNEPRFTDVPGLVSATLDFGSGRIATITASYGSTTTSYFNVIGTAGTVRLSPAFDLDTPLTLEVQTAAGTEREQYPMSDQFAPEIIEFCRCITEHTEPESSGLEGLADVRIIEAIERSAAGGHLIDLPDFKKPRRPDLTQTAQVPPARNHAPLVHARNHHRSADTD